MLTVLATNPPIPDIAFDNLASDLTTVSVLIRLGIAATLGALIGLERKMADKPADGRTMMLICAGAAAFVLLGLQIAADAAETGSAEITRIDSTRVLSYIISGIGFLGAGAILHSKKAVIGLTTAAAIWVAAAIGAACGLAKFDTAFAMFGIVIVALWAPWVLRIAKDDDDDDDDSHAGNRRTSRKGSDPTPKHESHDANETDDEPAEKSGGKSDKNGKSGGKNGKDDKGGKSDKNSGKSGKGDKDSKDDK